MYSYVQIMIVGQFLILLMTYLICILIRNYSLALAVKINSIYGKQLKNNFRMSNYLTANVLIIEGIFS